MNLKDKIALSVFVIIIGAFIIKLMQLSINNYHSKKNFHKPKINERKPEFSFNYIASRVTGVIFLILMLWVIFGVVNIGLPFIWSMVEILFSVIILVLILASFIRNQRMCYTRDGALGLKQLVGELKQQNNAGELGVLDIEGVWASGYPKVLLLFESDDFVEQAQTTGLLSRIEAKVTDTVRSELSFGPNRDSFDAKQAIWATANINHWESVLKNVLVNKGIKT
jgi:hypothetical protein